MNQLPDQFDDKYHDPQIQAGWNPYEPEKWAKDHPNENQYAFEARVEYYHCDTCEGHTEYIEKIVTRCSGAADAEKKIEYYLKRQFKKYHNYAVRAIFLKPVSTLDIPF